MFAMIFVNDITFRRSNAQEAIPAWVRHFDKGPSGMTFVDVVFPAFLFLVGMSIPFALGARLKRSLAIWKILVDIVLRTLSLLLIGVLMVNDAFDSKTMGWPDSLWSVLMYLGVILTFCSFPHGKAKGVLLIVRIVGFLGLVGLALAFRGQEGRRLVTFWPFSIHTGWFGILGLIGGAYLVAAVVFLLFRANRTALLGCAVLLMCLYPAARSGVFGECWFAKHISIGTMLGSQAAIAVFGMLLATVLISPDTAGVWLRTRFTLLLIAGLAVGALLLNKPWGVNKIKATPSWCLWSSAITAGLWLLFYFLCDVLPLRWVTKPFSVAGQNVLLAYLLYNLLNPTLGLVGAGEWYERLAEPNLASAMGRSAGCAVVVLTVTTLLNWVGFRLRL